MSVKWCCMFSGLTVLVISSGLLASAAETPVEVFAQLPNMQSASLSPDGKALAYLRPIDGEPRLFIQELDDPDAKVKLVPSVDQLRMSWVEWANNDRLVFVMEFFAQRFLTETVETRLLSIGRDGKDMQSIIKAAEADITGSRLAKRKYAAPQLQGDVVSWLPQEPDHILVALDGDQNAQFEVRKVNINTGDFSLMVGNIPGIQRWIADQSGVVRFGYGYTQRELRTVVRTAADGSLEPANSVDWIAAGWYPTGFTDNPQIILVSGYGDNNKYQVRELHLQTGEFRDTVFEDAEYDARTVIQDRYNRPLGVRYIGHHARDVYFLADYAKLQRSIDKALPATSNRIVSTSDDLQRVLIETTSDVDPGVLLLWDRTTKRMDPVAEIMPGIDPEVMSATTPVSYAARDGLNIPAYLTLPLGKPKSALPAVVIPHGGPARRADASFWFLSQFLAARGYAVLQPNFRGSTGYGIAFKSAGRQQWGGTMQDDVTDGAKWLIEQGIADPDRLCIAGWSYGGYSAAMGAVISSDLFKCAASINGVLNLVELTVDDKKYIGGRQWLRQIGLDGAKLTEVSPYHKSDAIGIPLLIIQARDDARVHLNQAEGMAKRLKKQKKPVRLVLVDKGGHSMEDVEARRTILLELETFLQENIGQ